MNFYHLLVLIVSMKNDETIYQVFQKLSDFVKDRHIRLTKNEEKKDRGQAPRPVGDERDDFLTAMRDVKRIDAGKKRIREGAHKASFRSSNNPADSSMKSALKSEYAFSVVNIPEYMEGYVEGINPLTLERLRNGDYSIQAVIDLHGLSVTDAKETFDLFVADAVRKQLFCIKVIHGRGLKSRSGPVLKERLKEWIVRAMHRKWVVAFCSSRMTNGGPGATVILLRSHAKKKRLRIVG